ncbi:MFS transporter [Streptomyces sp. NPDC058373]|uniref:MFS transporter n=1 Tax=Streptomyces sp. NPDC058373 TaxID=3346465 RepID=UPI003648D12D
MTTAETGRAEHGEAAPPAGIPGAGAPQPEPAAPSRARRLLLHPVTLTTALAATLHVLWFFTFANSGGDLAAQDAWAEFVGRNPDSAYNLAWYGGMHPVSYSVVSPYLMHVLGVRTTMMLVGTVSAALLALLLIRSGAVPRPGSGPGSLRRALLPAFAGVYGLVCNAVSGRVTFGLGMMFGLAAVAAFFCWPHRWRRRRWAKGAVAAVLAGLATAGSPVAGLFVGFVAVALFVSRRRPAAYALGLAPAAVVAVSTWLFPFSGTQPMSLGSAALPFAFGVLVCVLVPRHWVTVRITSGVYALAVLVVWAVHSQIGSNVTRLPMLFAGAVLMAAMPFTVRASRKWYALVGSLVLFAGWIGVKSVDDVVNTTPIASWNRELAPLVSHLDQAGADQGRVEVVPSRSHREASALAPYVNLARGWNRQADVGRNPLFYDGSLNAATYRAWLDRWAVHYVVLPGGDLDGDGGERERALIERGQPYLDLIWSDANWQLYAVEDPTPLADPPALVRRAEQGAMTLDVLRPGRVLVRLPYSPWLSVVDADGNSLPAPEETARSRARTEADPDLPKQYTNRHGCLAPTDPDTLGTTWTELVAPKAGTYRIAAPYDFPRGTACPEEIR